MEKGGGNKGLYTRRWPIMDKVPVAPVVNDNTPCRASGFFLECKEQGSERAARRSPQQTHETIHQDLASPASERPRR